MLTFFIPSHSPQKSPSATSRSPLFFAKNCSEYLDSSITDKMDNSTGAPRPVDAWRQSHPSDVMDICSSDEEDGIVATSSSSLTQTYHDQLPSMEIDSDVAKAHNL